MNWLKSEICHAHGYSSPMYTYIKGQSLEDVKYDIRNGPDGDRDGIREPRWTLLETLPPEVLAAKIKEAEYLIRSGHWWIEELTGVPHQGADALREALVVEMRAQINHLVNDLCDLTLDEFGLLRYVPKPSLMFHNMVAALVRWSERAVLAQHQAPQQGEQHE